MLPGALSPRTVSETLVTSSQTAPPTPSNVQNIIPVGPSASAPSFFSLSQPPAVRLVSTSASASPTKAAGSAGAATSSALSSQKASQSITGGFESPAPSSLASTSNPPSLASAATSTPSQTHVNTSSTQAPSSAASKNNATASPSVATTRANTTSSTSHVVTTNVTSSFASLTVNTQSPSRIPTPTALLATKHAHSGFFANRPAVGSVFAFVAIFVLILLGFLVGFLFHHCGRQRKRPDIREPTLPDLQIGRSAGEPHYKRTSQILSPVTSANVRTRSQRWSFSGSDESHPRTHRSTEPLLRQDKDPFTDSRAVPSPVPEYPEVLFHRRAGNIFTNASHHSVHSTAGTTPSIYPPTLPANDEDEYEYWRRLGRPPTPRPVHNEGDVPQQSGPLNSSLGLWLHGSDAMPVAMSEVQHKHPVSQLRPDSSHGSGTTIVPPPNAMTHDSWGPEVLDSAMTVTKRGDSKYS